MVAVGAGFVPAASKELWARAVAMRVHSSGSVHSHQAATLQALPAMKPRHQLSRPARSRDAYPSRDGLLPPGK